MNDMSKIVVVFISAVIVEGLVEYATTVAEMVEHKTYKKAAKQLFAIGLAVFICFQCGADAFAACGLHFALPWLGTALTGVFGSRGANYLSDFIKRLQSAGTRERV